METLYRIKNWFAALFGYRRRNSDPSEEIESHIEMRTDLNIESGMDPKTARAAAIKEFGGLDKLKEQSPDAWGMRIIVDQLRNLLFGLRLSIRYSSSSILAICVLGIGISTSIAMYTISTIGLDISAGGNLNERHQLLDWDNGTRKGNAINTHDFKIIQEKIDPFDRPQLAAVLRTCRGSKNLPDAGRKLFAVSRQQKKTSNDSDRLRKYLAKFGLTWETVAG